MKYFILVFLLMFDPSKANFVDDVAKKLKSTEKISEFSTLLQTLPLKSIFADKSFQNELLKAGMSMNYIKVLASSDLLKVVDLPKMMKTVQQGDGSSKVLFGALLNNLDTLKSIRNMDFAKMVLQGGLKDGVVYVPGLPLGLSIDCGLEFMKLFGDMLTGNSSFLDPATIGKLMGSPAGKMVDSWGKIPPGILNGNSKWHGAYDECMAIENAKYCSVGMLALGSVTGIYGTCMPNICSEQDITSIYSSLISKQLGGMIMFTDKPKEVWCVEEHKYTTGFIVTLVLCCIILLLLVLGTFVEIAQGGITDPDHKDKKTTVISNRTAESCAKYNIEMKETSNKEQEMDIDNKPRVSGFFKFLLCFAIVKNTRVIMSCKSPKGAIRSINGIRVISMFWVILGHFILFIAGNVDNLYVVFQRFLTRWTSQAVINAYSSVDTFFVLSGLLVSYLTLKRMDKSDGKINIGLYYLHRFIRITPPYMFVILFSDNITPYLISGPLGPMRQDTGQGKACNKYWWTNLLYINNFHPKFGEQCLGWSWYLANDMQFYLLAPGILYAFYVLDKKYKNSKYRYYGPFLITFGGCFICIIVRMILISVENLPGDVAGSFKENSPYQAKDRQDYLYSKPWTRISPYLIGLFLGYILSRKVKITFRKTLIYTLGWIAAFGFGYAVIYGPYESAFKDPTKFLSKTENILYGSFSAFTWSLAIAWVIFACENGHGGLINNFLSWNVWIPLSRLTFGAYLLHPIVLDFYGYNHEKSFHYQDNLVPFNYVGTLVYSYIAAFILAITVEYPVLNLEKLLFKS